jgi:hypothetical protein
MKTVELEACGHCGALNADWYMKGKWIFVVEVGDG